MWEKRIIHEGLKTFRVIRGYTQEEVEIKARLQLAVWAERWQRRQEIELARQKQVQKRTAWEEQTDVDKRRKSLALHRTLEAEAAVEAAKTLLSSALAELTKFDWDDLRDSTEFLLPEPQSPLLKPLPDQPRYDEFRFQSAPLAHGSGNSGLYAIGRLARSMVELIVPSVRWKRERQAQEEAERRKAEAVRKFADARSEWQKLTDQIKGQNQTAQNDYEKALLAWKAEKAHFFEQQNSFNASVDALRVQYLNRSPEALIRYWTEVLNRSQYPDSFPRDFKFHFQSDTGVLALDYELPNQDALPKLKSVKYIANRQEFQEVPLSEGDFRRLCSAPL
jgi:restriction system protein